MRLRAFVSLIGFTAALIAFAQPAANAQSTEGVETAKFAIEQFCRKCEVGNLDGVTKTVGTPFCYNGGGNPDQLVEEVATNENSLKKMLKDFVDVSKGKKILLKITATMTYPEFLKVTGDLLKKEGPRKKDREALDRSLEEEGYVVLAKVGHEKESFPVGFLVARRKGEPKVVGILHGLTDPTKKW